MRPPHPRIARALLVLLALLALPAPARADDIDDLAGSWVGRALRAQRLLDRRTPLHDIDVVGAHNSFNSGAYASGLRYLDPNQSASIFNLLRMGARAIELDVHWTSKSEGPFSYPDRLLLCHGTASHVGCSVDDRYLSEGIDEISAWFGTADSIDQVLLLHIEDHMDGHHGEALAEIQSRIGYLVYGSGGCGDIPANLTKADVLAAGKRIVLWNEGGCSGDAGWNSMVFTGLGAIRRVWEDSTTIGGGSLPPIGPGEVASAFAGDVNIVDLDQLTAGDARWAAAVWSWDVGEPNDIGNEDCAAQMGNGRWNDAPCTQQRAFACENVVTGGWAVTAATGPWGLGATSCDALGADFRFSVPTNSLDNTLLRGAKAAAGLDVVWLNHDDRAIEGEWVSPDSDDVLLDPGAFRLAANQAVYGKTRMLRMEPNCNLVLYSLQGDVVGGGLWASGTANAGSNCRVDFQADGNLVLYDGAGRALWNSNTSGAELRLQSDGNLVLYDGNRNPLWNTFTNHPADAVANAGQFGLAAGGAWQSANRRLVLRGDCGLELVSFENGVVGGVTWRSGTAGAGTGCRLDFQADGNLVVYDGAGRALWASGTSGTVGAQLRMQADGNLVVYNGANQPLWATLTNAPVQAVIPAGSFSMRAGDFVQTRNRKLELRDTCELLLHSVDNFLVGGLLWRSGTAGAGTDCRADLQPDGNFVLYAGDGRALWAAGTSGTIGAQLRLQADGNLVVYNGANEPLWSSYTAYPAASSFDAGRFALTPGGFVRHENRLLLLQPDCGLVLYMTRNALPVLRVWDSNTFGAATDCRLDFQQDGNLVLYDGSLRPLWAAGTSGTSGAQLRLQADGNLVLYNGAGAPLWTSQTPGNFSGVALCGDATCNGSENCSSCAGDCGGCPPPPCTCGDGQLSGNCGEQCDDGNVVAGDGCDAACQIEVCACGDGQLSGNCGEQCDDGNVVAGDGCDAACRIEVCACGDGQLAGSCGEQCDDGNVVAGDGCDAACRLEACGPVPRTACQQALQAKLQYDEKRPGREQFLAQWKKIAGATTQAGFGDPVGGDAAVAICLYDDAGRLVQGLEVDRAGAACGGRPCWSALGGKGYAYGDKAGTADGIQKIGYVAGDAGRGKADVQGRNDATKGQSALPVGVVAALSGQRAVTMQLSTSAGACISATLRDVTRDDGLQYTAARK